MTVSNQIIEVLDALCTRFGLAIDWTSDNIIPYAETLFGKLVTYEIWSSVAWIGFIMVLFIINIAFLKKTWPDNHNDIDYEIPVTMISSCVFAVTFVVVILQVLDIIKCVTFPEMFVYQYIRDLIEVAH